MPDGTPTKPVPQPAPPKPPAPPIKSAAAAAFSGLRISLMPSDLEGAKGPDLFKRLLILALVIVLETGVMGGINYWLVSRTASQKSELDKEVKRVDYLIKSSAQKEKELGEVSAFNQQMGALSDALDGHAYWTSFFDWLEKNTKPTVAYRSFGGDLSSGVVTMDAAAENYREAAEQMVIFRESPMVLNYRGSALSAFFGSGGALEGVSFTVNLKLKPDVWARPVTDITVSEAEEEEEQPLTQ